MSYTRYSSKMPRPSGELELIGGRHVLLCGFMAAGKSSIGRCLAGQLNISFIDLDKVIEQKEAMAVSRIFKNKGETYFRKLELECLEDTLAKGQSVIALGGGTLQSQETVNYLKDKGLLVYLDVPLPLIINRLKNNKTRPLLYNEDGSKKDLKKLQAFLYNLHKSREILYVQADYHLKVDPNWNRDFTVNKVAEYIRQNVSYT